MFWSGENASKSGESQWQAEIIQRTDAVAADCDWSRGRSKREAKMRLKGEDEVEVEVEVGI